MSGWRKKLKKEVAASVFIKTIKYYEYELYFKER
jgi:hypothetical protein